MARFTRFIAVVFVAITGTNCVSNDFMGEAPVNQPPDVRISSGPADGSITSHEVRFYWVGDDPDGSVHFCEYAITDDDSDGFDATAVIPADRWHRVYRNDSIFKVTADELFDSASIDPEVLKPLEFRRAHTFVVRAVDDRGQRSLEPAHRSFTATNLSPVVDIVRPSAPGAVEVDVSSVSTFVWSGRDFIGSEEQAPDSARFILVSVDSAFGGDWDGVLGYIRGNPDDEEWSQWRDYNTLDGSGTRWTTPLLDLGLYVFAVQVKDDAGAVSAGFDLDRNLRTIRVVGDDPPPPEDSLLLTLTCNDVDTFSITTRDTVLDVGSPAVTPVRCCWTVDDAGGALISGYRFGWDIADLNDDEQWEIDYTPFVGAWACSPLRTFDSGTHTFHLEIIDSGGRRILVALVFDFDSLAP